MHPASIINSEKDVLLQLSNLKLYASVTDLEKVFNVVYICHGRVVIHEMAIIKVDVRIRSRSGITKYYVYVLVANICFIQKGAIEQSDGQFTYRRAA